MTVSMKGMNDCLGRIILYKVAYFFGPISLRFFPKWITIEYLNLALGDQRLR